MNSAKLWQNYLAGGKAVWKTVVAALLGAALGVTITLAITSQTWLVASIVHNLNWRDGREWIGALSGWAAFGAAALSLPYLIGQWREAQRQTSFTIGDEYPTLDVIEHLSEKKQLVVRLVNWNRRTIFIQGITVTSDSTDLSDTQTAIWSAKNRADNKIEEGFPFKIPGWEDRAKPPCLARIDFYIVRRIRGSKEGAFTDETVDIPQDAKITAKIQMLGNVHCIFDLDGEVFPQQ